MEKTTWYLRLIIVPYKRSKKSGIPQSPHTLQKRVWQTGSANNAAKTVNNTDKSKKKNDMSKSKTDHIRFFAA